MSLKDILNVVAITVIVILLLGAFFLITQSQESKQSKNEFGLLSLDRAGDYGYAIFSLNGSGNVTLLAMDEKPKKDIYILRERGIAMDRFDELAAKIKQLEAKGMKVHVVSAFSEVKDGILLIPSGAMPFYVIDKLENNDTNAFVVYIGKKDLLINNTIRKEDWYDVMSEYAKSRIAVYESTPDEFFENINESFMNDMLENRWIAKTKRMVPYSGWQGSNTITINMENATYLRMIYESSNNTSFFDSKQLESMNKIESEKDVFPWEHTVVTFSLNSTNGTPYLIIERNGDEKKRLKLQRSSEENLFLERFQLDEPGDYIAKAVDGSGTAASGIIHIKELKAVLREARGNIYLFDVNIDGKGVESEKVLVSLNNSTKKQYYFISDGTLMVPAKLAEGKNTFHIEMFDTLVDVPVDNNAQDVFVVYSRYGIPAALIILVAYFFARMGRKPLYTIRIGHMPKETRREVRISKESVLGVFKHVRKDLSITGPITAYEFSSALKKYVTDGSDVTEGNVEEILKDMAEKGLIGHHGSYYQLNEEGDVKINTMKRMVREKLIEKGMEFKLDNNRFRTKDFEIVFAGEKIEKRGVIVFEDQNEIRNFYRSMNEKELATFKIAEANGKIRIMTIDKLDEIL